MKVQSSVLVFLFLEIKNCLLATGVKLVPTHMMSPMQVHCFKNDIEKSHTAHASPSPALCCTVVVVLQCSLLTKCQHKKHTGSAGRNAWQEKEGEPKCVSVKFGGDVFDFKVIHKRCEQNASGFVKQRQGTHLCRKCSSFTKSFCFMDT